MKKTRNHSKATAQGQTTKNVERARVLEIKCLGGNWVKGIIRFGLKGTGLGTKFEAKIYSEPSDYGINNGHVSKLFVRGLVNYDRGWDEGETNEAIWGPVVEALEIFARTPEFLKQLGIDEVEASGHTEPEESCEGCK